MRCRDRCRRRGPLLAYLAIGLGALILLILLLPAWVWFLLGGCALLIGGVLLLKRS